MVRCSCKPYGVAVERRRGDTDLLAHERNQLGRCTRLEREAEPGVSQQREVDGKADLVGAAASCRDQRGVAGRQHITPREILAISGYAEQRLPFGFGEKFASCHDLGPSTKR